MRTMNSLSTKHLCFISHRKMVYLLVIGILLSETIAIGLLKEYSMTSNLAFYILGILFYVLVTMLLVQSFKYEGIGIVNVLWSAFSMLLVVGVGVIFFKEHLNLPEIVGVSMVFGGVVVLRYFTG